MRYFCGLSLFLFTLSGLTFAQDSYMYVCHAKNGSVNFTDRPCTANTSQKSYEKIKPLPPVNTVDARKTLNQFPNSNRVVSSVNNHCQRINIFEINKKYDVMVFDARFKYQRESEQAVLKSELSRIEFSRRNELRGCV